MGATNIQSVVSRGLWTNLVPWLLVAMLMSETLWAQVCSTQTLGNQDWLAVSGSSDTNVIATSSKGEIYRFDGTSWLQMASPTTSELRDVEVVDGATAFAAGKGGRILQLASGVWSQVFAGAEDLNAVWAASASEAYVGGRQGLIYRYDGTSWIDASASAGTDRADIEDAWGDALGAYLLDDDGVLYRYDRAAGLWDAPDSSCAVAQGFTDLWGDGSGNLFLTARKDVYRYDGSACTRVASSQNENLEGVYGAATGEIYAVGRKGTVMQYDGATWQEVKVAQNDLHDVWVSQAGTVYYSGKGGEVTICGANVVDFVISHDNFGIHCLPEAVTVDALDGAGNPHTGYSGSVMLDTQSGRGSWRLVSGGGVLTDSVANDGVASYDWPLGESRAVFELDYREGAPLIDIDVYQSSNTAMRDDDSEGAMIFSASGFTLTAAPLGNPPPGIIQPFDAAQTAGAVFPIYLTAYGQTPNDPACGVIESYTGTKSLEFWSQYVDPGTGTIPVRIDGAPIAAAEAGAASQSVVFTNGQAAVSTAYKDVGRLQILVKDDTTVNAELPAGIRGATAPFVVRPFDFALSNIRDAAGGIVNPQAAGPNDPIFIAAGAPFRATVVSLDADGDATPNYGRESTPETVRLEPEIVAPAGGNVPPVSAAAGFGAFANGTATGLDFTWPEVGIVRLRGAIGDGDYLGSGDVIGGPSERIGRFVPDHFSVAPNAPLFAAGCAAGAFTYVGQPFNYGVAPELIAAAQAVGGTPTDNYTAAFFKLATGALPARVYTASESLDESGLPAPAGDPVVAEIAPGVARLTFGGGTGLRFVKSAPLAPFAADVRLSIDVVDADGVEALANPQVFGAASGIPFDWGAEIRYGRARVVNALGSERVDLAVPLGVEYFAGPGTGFVANVEDSCTTGVTLGLSNYTENLSAGETCALDIGSPGNSGIGCAAAAPAPRQFAEPPVAGDFNLSLAAPGAGNTGGVTVTAIVPSWLRYDWDATVAGDEDPAGQAVFGLYSGDSRRIYLREIY